MIIKIGNREYTLRFGFDFIDYCNKVNAVKVESVELNMGGGVTMLLGNIEKRLPSNFRTLIKGATCTENQKPSNADIEAYIEDLLENGKYDETFDEAFMEMGKHSLILKEIGITKSEWDEAMKKDEEAKKAKK